MRLIDADYVIEKLNEINGTAELDKAFEVVENAPTVDVLDKIRAEIEQLPTKTRTNWDGCCPDIDYPEIEYVDVDKNKLLDIIDKYRESEVKE